MTQPIFSFQITPMDIAAAQPQVSRALEKRTELESRRKYPKLWDLTDRLNRAEKASGDVRENRRRRRAFLGLLNWVFGIFLLTPGLLNPAELLVPLLVGTACFVTGTVTLWKSRRTLLGALSLFSGVVFCAGALGDPAQLGRFLIPGLACTAAGIAALATRKRARRTPFDRAAGQLLRGRDAPAGAEQTRVVFSARGMSVFRADRETDRHTVPWSQFEMVLETQDLFVPVCGGTVTILQKKDLLEGTPSGLRQFLAGQTLYVNLPEQAVGSGPSRS